jgi:hypothetical protein
MVLQNECLLNHRRGLASRQAEFAGRPSPLPASSSAEAAGIPSHPLAAPGEGGVLLVPERFGRFEDSEVVVELSPGLRRGERQGDRRVLKNEAIPVRDAGDREPRRVVGRRPEERPPAKGGVGDDGQTERPRDRKHLSLGAPGPPENAILAEIVSGGWAFCLWGRSAPVTRPSARAEAAATRVKNAVTLVSRYAPSGGGQRPVRGHGQPRSASPRDDMKTTRREGKGRAVKPFDGPHLRTRSLPLPRQFQNAVLRQLVGL